MIILISGATHTGKTALSQQLMEKYKIPYYSIDHIKMGLIRSGNTPLTAGNDNKLTTYLWQIVKEIIITAIENRQNLIIEGCYIPFDWRKDFNEKYLNEIQYYCLIMTENYIENNFADIVKFENVIERRLVSKDITKEELIAENKNNLQNCKQYSLNYILIDKTYYLHIEL